MSAFPRIRRPPASLFNIIGDLKAAARSQPRRRPPARFTPQQEANASIAPQSTTASGSAPQR